MTEQLRSNDWTTIALVGEPHEHCRSRHSHLRASDSVEPSQREIRRLSLAGSAISWPKRSPIGGPFSCGRSSSRPAAASAVEREERLNERRDSW